MRGARSAGAMLAAVASACSITGTGHGVRPSPSVIVVSSSPAPSPSPSATPSEDGPLEVGGAAISTTGGLTMQVGFPTLAEPDVWAAPPGPMDVTWDEPSGQSLTLSGTSFTSRAATGADRVLSFVLTGPQGPVQFTSAAGECSVTISPALPTDMGGVFTCTGIADVNGTTTVSATGTFSATG